MTLNEQIINAAKQFFNDTKGGPCQYTVLSSKQIERLRSGESEFEIGTGTCPIITRKQFLEEEKKYDNQNRNK